MAIEFPKRLLIACFLLAILAVILVKTFFSPPSLLQLDGATMGTSYQLLLPELPGGLDRQALADEVQARLDRLDREIFSTWQSGSEVSRFNRHPLGQDFEASAELLEVVLLGQEIHRLSGGAFDITVGPLTELWGFGPAGAPRRTPGEGEWARALARVDSGAVDVLPQRGVLRRQADVELDLSGIAKGYAVDQLAAWLEGLGIRDYLLEIGGELLAAGERRPGRPWRLAIEAPAQGPSQAFGVFGNRGGRVAAAGSGDYRNFREVGGQRYSHELDPRSGRPIAHQLAAVTVLAPEAGRADALATALMVLGPERGFELAAGLDLPAYFIIRDGADLRARHTDAFEPYLAADRPAGKSQDSKDPG